VADLASSPVHCLQMTLGSAVLTSPSHVNDWAGNRQFSWPRAWRGRSHISEGWTPRRSFDQGKTVAQSLSYRWSHDDALIDSARGQAGFPGQLPRKQATWPNDDRGVWMMCWQRDRRESWKGIVDTVEIVDMHFPR